MELYDKESCACVEPKGARNEPLDRVVYTICTSLAPAVKAEVVRDSQWEALERHCQLASLIYSKHMQIRTRSTQNRMRGSEMCMISHETLVPVASCYRRGVRSKAVH